MKKFIDSAKWYYFKRGKWVEYPIRVTRKIEKAYLRNHLEFANIPVVVVDHNGIEYRVDFRSNYTSIDHRKTYVGRTLIRSKSI